MNSKYHLVILCGLGSLVRFLYGYYFSPWNQSPDQLAWELLLSDGSLRYDQFIHYPHEGGTVLISVFSRFIKLFTNFNSLAVSAFVLDFGIRFIQLRIVLKVFNQKKAVVFGLWMVFATSVLIPWGTVNFGLHYISSIFPFVLLYLLWIRQDTKNYHLKSGLFLGLAFWFSYSNIILIPVFYLFQVFAQKGSLKWLYSVVSLAVVLILHIGVRMVADAGFHLGEMDLGSIRETEFLLNDWQTWKKLYQVWTKSLAGASISVPSSSFWIKTLKYLWISIVFLGWGGCLKFDAKGLLDKAVLVSLGTILLFVSLYAISPFYNDGFLHADHVSFRHLTYILPFVSLMTIVGLFSWKFKAVWIGIYMLIGVYGTGLLFTEQPSGEVSEKAVGWVIGVKIGHDPERVYRVISISDQDRQQLVQGVGWGICTELFKNSRDSDPIARKTKILLAIVNDFPNDAKNDLIDGIGYAFGKNLSPRLDESILLVLLDELCLAGYVHSPVIDSL